MTKMKGKILITREQAERTGTISFSDSRCPECGSQICDMPADFFNDASLQWCSNCDWKNFEVVE